MSDAKFILAGTLLTAASEPVLRDRLVRIRGDVVESVEPLPPAPPETSTGALVIDARDKVVMPGLINGHCHHTEVLQRSLRDRVPFELWLPERRGIEDALDPGYDDLLAANHIALLENLKHGTTTVLHHLSRRGALDLHAKALGLNAGRIAAGHLADICILKPGTRMWPAADLVQSLVYSENGRSVDTVLVSGKVLLQDGASPRIDEAALDRQAATLAERVAQAGEQWTGRKSRPEVAERLRAAEEEYREAASAFAKSGRRA